MEDLEQQPLVSAAHVPPLTHAAEVGGETDRLELDATRHSSLLTSVAAHVTALARSARRACGNRVPWRWIREPRIVLAGIALAVPPVLFCISILLAVNAYARLHPSLHRCYTDDYQGTVEFIARSLFTAFCTSHCQLICMHALCVEIVLQALSCTQNT